MERRSGTTGACRAAANARRAGLFGGGLLVRAAMMRVISFDAALHAVLMSAAVGMGEPVQCKIRASTVTKSKTKDVK